jgi:Protein of unknown function (DUF2946)
MFSQKLFRLVSKIALFAIVFASLAPGISQALAMQNKSILQAVCSSSGAKVVIQVFTTQGKQLATEFSISKPQPKSSTMHLEHCPFCGSSAAAAVLPSNHLIIIGILETSAQKAAQYAAPVFLSHTCQSPPSHAPPSLLA